MVFIDLAAGFFRQNARSEGAAGGGGVWGEFRRALAFRIRPDCFGKKFGFCSGDTATLYESERLPRYSPDLLSS